MSCAYGPRHRFLMPAYLKGSNLGLRQSLDGDSKWLGVHLNGRAVVNDFTRAGSRFHTVDIDKRDTFAFRTYRTTL
jgi:hypothetical protein